MGGIANLDDYTLSKILLFRDPNYSQLDNSYKINRTIKYLVDSERFCGSLLLELLAFNWLFLKKNLQP